MASIWQVPLFYTLNVLFWSQATESIMLYLIESTWMLGTMQDRRLASELNLIQITKFVQMQNTRERREKKTTKRRQSEQKPPTTSMNWQRAWMKMIPTTIVFSVLCLHSPIRFAHGIVCKNALILLLLFFFGWRFRMAYPETNSEKITQKRAFTFYLFKYFNFARSEFATIYL